MHSVTTVIASPIRPFNERDWYNETIMFMERVTRILQLIDMLIFIKFYSPHGPYHVMI